MTTDNRITGPTDRSATIDTYDLEREQCLNQFSRWSQADQIDFVQHLLHQMCHYQHGLIDTFLKPMLQRDFLSLLPKSYLDHIAEKILSYLDARSLAACEPVCREWHRVISDGMLWKKLIERQVKTDLLWRGLSDRRGWHQFLFKCKPVSGGGGHNALSRGFLNFQTFAPTGSGFSLGLPSSFDSTNHGAGPISFNQSPGFPPDNTFYHRLYPTILKDISNLESNWRLGKHALRRIRCRSENSKGVYCLQYDDHKIVSGLRDNTIKIWDFKTLECLQILTGHTGSVLCLQYDERIIVTGSSDATVRIWDVNTGEMLNTLIHHCEAVLHLRFEDGVMVTCSKDRSIAVWDMQSPTDITLRRVLVGHRAAVNVVDFDQKYIVSASGDRTIKVWDTSSCEFIRTLNGHKRGIACLQYRERLIVSGSSDYTIRLWDIECGACLRILEGHEELVRCIRFDNKRIVSGAYDGKIKVWDLAAALDPRTPAGSVCVRTLVEHTGRVFRLQFDEFQIVSSSHDDTILVWDFLNYECPAEPLGGLQTGPEDDSNPPIDEVIMPHTPGRDHFQNGDEGAEPEVSGVGIDNSSPSTTDGAHVVSSHPSLAQALRSSLPAHPVVAMEECQDFSAPASTTFVNCTLQAQNRAQNASIASFANGFTRASLTPNLELPYQGPQIHMVGTSCATYNTNFFRQPSLSVTSQPVGVVIQNASNVQTPASSFDMFRRHPNQPEASRPMPAPPLEDMTLDALGTDLEQLEDAAYTNEEGSSPG